MTPRTHPTQRRRDAVRRRSGGFTLVELMVSLIMGVIVSLAAVALSRAATTTFYEQAKISHVEASVRTASERFRNDLLRVAYMSTPNIQVDPKVANDPSKDMATDGYRIATLSRLQGIAITPAASGIETNTLTTDNGLTPQDVIITGNLTSDDTYRGLWISATAACNGAGAQIRLNGAADPAVRRLYNGAANATARKTATEAVFMPGRRMNPADASTNYAVQVMDARGCFHYMTVCDVQEDPQADAVQLSLAGDSTRGILTREETLGDVCGASLMEEVAIAPVHRVRWYIGPETLESRNDSIPGSPDELDGPLPTTRKFNLYRQLLDGDTTAVATATAPFGATPVGPPELIAEYAIDLKLGLVVDAVANSIPSTVTVDLEGAAADFTKWAGPNVIWAAAANKNSGPQRIRSVRYRMAFRAPYPDRAADLPMPGSPPYLARYKMVTGSPPVPKWARVRTVMSEVALLNQSKAVY
jgi:type II secretory pathway pseudopilin PulG